MGTMKMEVKDLLNFFGNLDGFYYRLIVEFYREDGHHIGEIEQDYTKGYLTVSKELMAVWRNKVKFSRMYTLQNEVIITLVVLKGEER